MPTPPPYQLISYIAPGAPATRRVAEGDEPLLRPEIGFTPKWYHDRLGIDFGERWHCDPARRREVVVAMLDELRRRFPGTRIGGIDRPDKPLDLLTGLFGATTVAAIYGVPIVYAKDKWPDCEHRYLDDDEIDRLEPPDLDANPFFRQLLAQMDAIAATEGRVEGFINWQGVLNNAHRLRGEQVFVDLVAAPERSRRLFDCICTTMIEATRRVRERQRATGVDPGFFTIGNCLVNMVSPDHYRDGLLPFDLRLATSFDCIGIHNCAWNADPYLDHYAAVPRLAYIDMGLDSDLARARELFPSARRAVMYKPTDLANKSLDEIRDDFERIARDYAPCDVVLADIETDVPDERVLEIIEICRQAPIPFI